MYRTFTLISLALPFCSFHLNGQTHAELTIGDVRARFFANGRVAYDPNVGVFEIPQGSGTNTNYAGGLWVAGQTVEGATLASGTMYDLNNSKKFFPGPLTTNEGNTDQGTSAIYDRVWSLTREQITAHWTYFNCVEDPNCSMSENFPNGYTVPQDMLDWPAQGEIDAGYGEYLAPFYDRNGDGAYDPYDGDTPCILGDQALFSIFSDALGSMNGNMPLGIEVHQMPFAYGSSTPALSQTVFVAYRLINRSTRTYTNTMFGFFNDFDLGCPNDDFIGTDPSRNLQYIYNWSDFDPTCMGFPGYGNQPPAFGMTLIKGPLLDQTGQDEPASNSLPAWNGSGFGDAVTDNERHGLSYSMSFGREGPPPITDPMQPNHFYQYLQGRWKDGMPLTYGGSGYSLDPEAIPARYIYPGDDDPVGAGTDGQVMAPWREVEPTPATPDRRGVIGTGPITLLPGQNVDLLFAYVYARADSGGAFASVASLQARVDSVHAFARTLPLWDLPPSQAFGTCADYLQLGVNSPSTVRRLALFPNPSSEQVHFHAPRELEGGRLTVMDATGRIAIVQQVGPGLNAIDVSQLPSGIYGYQATSGTIRLTGKVVKQ
jgi:hypothetical protein